MENLTEKATNMELAMYWANEIDNPCEVKVGDVFENLRKSYINLVQREIIPILTNPYAIKLLEDTIKKYDKELTHSDGLEKRDIWPLEADPRIFM